MEIYADSPYRGIETIKVDKGTGEKYTGYSEISLEEELIEMFQKSDVMFSSIDITCVFDSPGLDVFSVSIAYIGKDGQLGHYTDSIDRC